VIHELEFVIRESKEKIKPKFITDQPPELLEETEDSLLYQLKNGLKLRLYTCDKNITERQFLTTGSREFNEAFLNKFPSLQYDEQEDDEIVFSQANIAYIPPCLRETVTIMEKPLPKLVQTSDIKSIIHSHSNWSDGLNTIEEMALALIKKGYEYLVISDHSKSAFYANGLSEERIREQHRYVDELNQKLKPFKIFKSTECDILNDGSLDYSNSVLATFDLIITSIHSNLKMGEEKAMMRLIGAITNPYTTILGHMTGRLLLSRNGYPVDHKKIVDACASHHVAIELNAHPRRLDIDWRFIDYAIQKNVLISIDPDAHSIEGFEDVKYGVLAAQKGGLTKEQNLSSYSLKEFEDYLEKRKKLRGI
jgi:DNA polymerase (family 10)